MSPDEQAIRDVIATWLSASAAGDTSKVLSLIADDVVFLVAGRPPFGKKEFAASQDALRTHRIETTSDVREVIVDRDLAFARSHLTVTMTPIAGGQPLRRMRRRVVFILIGVVLLVLAFALFSSSGRAPR